MRNAGWIGGSACIASVLPTLAVGINAAIRPGPLKGFFVVSMAAFVGLVVEGLAIDSDRSRYFFILTGQIWGFADACPVLTGPSDRRLGDRGVLTFRGWRAG